MSRHEPERPRKPSRAWPNKPQQGLTYRFIHGRRGEIHDQIAKGRVRMAEILSSLTFRRSLAILLGIALVGA